MSGKLCPGRALFMFFVSGQSDLAFLKNGVGRIAFLKAKKTLLRQAGGFVILAYQLVRITTHDICRGFLSNCPFPQLLQALGLIVAPYLIEWLHLS